MPQSSTTSLHSTSDTDDSSSHEGSLDQLESHQHDPRPSPVPSTDGPRRMTIEQYRTITQKLQQLQQIRVEEELVHQRMTRLHMRKERLKNLLTVLKNNDSDDE